MDKGDVIQPWDIINSCICDNMERPWVYVKWDKSEKTTIIWSHLEVYCKIAEPIKTENRMVVTRNWGTGRIGKIFFKGKACNY